MTTDPQPDGFQEDPAPPSSAGGRYFVVDLDGYEGPLDVLLSMARDQKVDLAHISILALAEQYLAFVEQARRDNLELAADYLVMAAWLAYLKSRLLLPVEEEEQPAGEAMAAALAFQLRRLQAMRDAGAALMKRPRLGTSVFRRGAPERFATVTNEVIEATLYDLLKAYGAQRKRVQSHSLLIAPPEVYSMEDSLHRLSRMLGVTLDWDSLWRYLPENVGTGVVTRSAYASTFAAALELAKQGRVQLRQSGAFGPIFLRSQSNPQPHVAGPERP